MSLAESVDKIWKIQDVTIGNWRCVSGTYTLKWHLH